MKPQLFALLTALAWGVGGYFEKKGLHLGQLSPQIGITLLSQAHESTRLTLVHGAYGDQAVEWAT